MSVGIPPSSSSPSSTQTASGVAPRSVPIGIASANSTMASYASCCGVRDLCSAVYHLLARLWAGIRGIFSRERAASATASPSLATGVETQRSNSRDVSLTVSEPQDSLTWEHMVEALNTDPDKGPMYFLNENITLESLQRICGRCVRRFEKRISVDQFTKNYEKYVKSSIGQQLPLSEVFDLELISSHKVFIDGTRYESSQEIFRALLQQWIGEEMAKKVLVNLTCRGMTAAERLATALFIEHETLKEYKLVLGIERPTSAAVMFKDAALKEVIIWVDFKIFSQTLLKTLFKVSTVTRIDGTTGHAVVTGTTGPS